MQQIINFIIRKKKFLLFLLLFGISLSLTIQSHSYHKSKFINSAHFLTGSIYNTTNTISNYFKLNAQNQLLSEENRRLRTLLTNNKIKTDSIFIDSLMFGEPYKFYTSHVIKNSYTLSNNLLTLDKGENDSIKEDFGVISPKGIIGIINKTSNNYSTVISILSKTSRISAQLQKTNHFGTLTWDGETPEFNQLIDIPKIAPVAKGDTIITSGRSSIFPKGIPIGVVDHFKLDRAENYYEINIKLFNDMTSTEYVYIIEDTNKAEITNLLSDN